MTLASARQRDKGSARILGGTFEDDGLMPGLGNEEDTPLLDKQNRPRFKALEHITLRAEPFIDAERTGVLKKDTVFEGYDIATTYLTGGSKRTRHWPRLPLCETCYVKLGEGRGWAISSNPATEEPLLEIVETGRPGISGVKQWLRKVFLGRAYDVFISIVVIANAILIYVEIDHYHYFSDRAMRLINLFFSIVYLTEVVLKLFAFGIQQYLEDRWNILDFCTTIVTLLADIGPYLGGALGTMALAVGSIAPVARLLRLLRLAREVKELAHLLESFVRSVIGLLWIGILMGMWFFICACITTTFIGNKTWMPDGAIPEAKFLRERFNTIPRSIFALLEVMTLEGWPDIVRPLMVHSLGLTLFFICFIFLTAFVLLNLVTAVVVEKMVAAQHEGDCLKLAADGDTWEMALCDLHTYLSQHANGETRVNRSELGVWLAKAEVKKLLDFMGWDKDLVLAACAILDTDSTGQVCLDDLTSVMSGAQRPLVTISLLRMQADLVERMGKQDQILRDVFAAKQEV